MKIKLKFEIKSDNNDEIIEESETLILNKECNGVEDIGLSISESKEILKYLQFNVVKAQADKYMNNYNHCDECKKKMRKNGYNSILFRTLFGNISLKSPKLYNCDCKSSNQKTFSPLITLFSERTSPELLYFESKLSSLMSYEMSEKIIKDFFPVDKKLNKSSIRLKTLEFARRCEDELGEEQVIFINGCQLDWDKLPPADDPITVGIDGAYIKQWKKRKKHFEVITGRSITADKESKYFGFVQRYDKKSKRRLYEVLNSQGMQQNQEIIFLSDGEEALSRLQQYLNPNACHVLDWFHITMKITVLNQFIKGLIKIDKTIGNEIEKCLMSTKWNLWHGHVRRAFEIFEDLEALTYEFEDKYNNFGKLIKHINEFHTYIKRNSPMIPDYSTAYHAGYPISTAFVESTVNSFIAKRFSKKQQMQWTEEGVHLLIQIRAKILNKELKGIFKKKYNNFMIESEEKVLNDKAA